MLSTMKKLNENKEIKKKFYDERTLNFEKTKYKIYSPRKNNLNITKEIEIDDELINLWDALGVTFEFRKRFHFKLSYFSKEYQKIIFESEKNKMKKIYDLIIKITNESIDKDKEIINLKRLNMILQNERNYNIEDDRTFIETKNTLNKLKNHLINIFNQINELRALITFDVINNKFDLSKMINSHILDPQFLLKLNVDIKVIKDNYIGYVFGIQNIFDPLLMQFSEGKENKKNYNAYYTFFNELIYNNYNPGKKNGKKVIIQRTNIDAKGNLKENISINKITNLSSFKEENENINKLNNINNLKESNLEFFKNDIFELENEYHNYYLNIPKEQKIFFNIKDNLEEYVNQINPIFITRKEKKGNLTLFCSLCNSNEENYSLEIKNFSVINNNEIKRGIKDVINYLNKNKVIYQNLTIDLYYDKNEKNLDKNLNEIFKELDFKWSKLENLEGGIRYQKMKYINKTFTLENNNKKHLYYIDTFNIISGIIIYNGNSNMEKINKNNNFDFNLNDFSLNVIQKMKEKKEESLINISSYLNNSINYNEITDLNEINKILNEKKIDVKLPLNQNNKILYNIFQINPQFESYIPVELKGKKYIRIKSKIEALIDKETNQKFYMIIMKDGNGLIISETNEKFNKILENKNNNIYKIFNEIYQKIEPIENEEISSIYIPVINKEIITKSNFIENSSIQNIQLVYNFYHISSSQKNSEFITNILPKENDVIINNSLFIAVINIEIANEYDIPSIFCCFLN